MTGIHDFSDPKPWGFRMQDIFQVCGNWTSGWRGCLMACGIDSLLEESLYFWMWLSWWNVVPNSFEYVAQNLLEWNLVLTLSCWVLSLLKIAFQIFIWNSYPYILRSMWTIDWLALDGSYKLPYIFLSIEILFCKPQHNNDPFLRSFVISAAALWFVLHQVLTSNHFIFGLGVIEVENRGSPAKFWPAT